MEHRNQYIRAIVAGILVGALLLALAFGSFALLCEYRARAESPKQRNLVAARGVSSLRTETLPVEIWTLAGQTVPDGTAVSADGYHWYMPEDGVARLPVRIGMQTFRAARGNRLVALEAEIGPAGESRVMLDIGEAPEAPDILFYELKKGGSATLSLDIARADTAELQHAPNGAEITGSGDGFVLSIDGSLLPFGFHSCVIQSENAAGSATTQLCLIVPRETPVIEITTAEELASMKDNLAGNYVLANDLDLGGRTDWPTIGTTEYPFTGTFDGGGHTITGYAADEGTGRAGLWNVCRNAVIKNLIIRDPDIRYLDSEEPSAIAVFCAGAETSWFDSCASLGGGIENDMSGAGGIVSGSFNSVFTRCFNSTPINNRTSGQRMPSSAGIAAWFSGYIGHCGNEGEMRGQHLIGGIAGYMNSGVINACWSNGVTVGTALVGEYPPGPLMQTMDAGRVSYGYFQEGATAAGRVFWSGAIIGIQPVAREDFRNPGALSALGSFGGDDPAWAYASLDAHGPVPHSIFKRQTPAPIVDVRGADISIAPLEGTRYFYSLEGSDPRLTCSESVESLRLTLGDGQVLRLFAARQGQRDSETISAQKEAAR